MKTHTLHKNKTNCPKCGKQVYCLGLGNHIASHGRQERVRYSKAEVDALIKETVTKAEKRMVDELNEAVEDAFIESQAMHISLKNNAGMMFDKLKQFIVSHSKQK